MTCIVSTESYQDLIFETSIILFPLSFSKRIKTLFDVVLNDSLIENEKTSP